MWNWKDRKYKGIRKGNSRGYDFGEVVERIVGDDSNQI
jgi:hypothetical protein